MSKTCRTPYFRRVAQMLSALFLMATWIPRAKAFERGHVLVVNRGASGITELDRNLALVRHWFIGETLGSSTLNEPNGLAMNIDGSLFIADSVNNRIVVVDGNGQFVREWSTIPGLGMNVESINFDADGELYASANPGIGTIARYTPTGEPMGSVVDGSQWLNLGNVNFGPAGELLVSPFSDQGIGIRLLNRRTGETLAPAFFTGSFERMEDLAVDGGGIVYANVYTGHEVAVFNADHSLRRRLTAPGLTYPTGIVITAACDIIVGSYDAEGDEPQLYVFAPDGTLRRQVYIDGLRNAESIAVVNQILPGSFEFPPTGFELVPACDAVTAVRDSGVADVSVAPANDARIDAGTDGMRPDLVAAGRRGCGCRTVGVSSQSPFLAVGIVLVALLYQRRRKGLHARSRVTAQHSN